ncbi:hypothetical protein FOXB_08654 [Fusarium oxysporum f. sp. conglutinans Fo5176]|uniref:Uncharacterized protein n=1 Tax=Fusarium oxysporum (strain Fo5176) TaxID=660025 RepID=F9FQH4_FUSOF|nr:hypothetical protein FOXB_08654 [Fusarium oxysporum f. sp. conglutinans Fo5176]
MLQSLYRDPTSCQVGTVKGRQENLGPQS